VNEVLRRITLRRCDRGDRRGGTVVSHPGVSPGPMRDLVDPAANLPKSDNAARKSSPIT
jgi:hypothetical protein